MKRYQIVDKYSLNDLDNYDYNMASKRIKRYLADSLEEATENAKKLVKSDNCEYYVVEVHTKVRPEKQNINVIVENIDEEITNDSISE